MITSRERASSSDFRLDVCQTTQVAVCLSRLPSQVNLRGSNFAPVSPKIGSMKTVLNGAAIADPSRGAVL